MILRKGTIEVEYRSDACTYLEYLVDIKDGKYNRYRCNLLYGGGSSHTCMRWGWCPMCIEAKEKGTPLQIEKGDIR